MVTVSTTEARIRENAAQNARLLKTLSETDYAISAYQQNNNYIGTLKKQILLEEKNLKEASQKTAKEYAEHEKYRDSHMKRLAYKLSGKKEKFAEEATKEEREWLDAVQLELKTKQGLEALKASLAEAQKTHAELFAVASVRGRTQLELDALYNSIFEGPTPDIPGEDERESEVKSAENEFNVVQLLLSTEKQARDILVEADRFLKRAMMDIRDALSSNTMDLWGGGMWTEMAEQSALARAQQNVSQVEMLLAQAQRVQPTVQHVGDVNVAEMNFWGNVMFDNVFSDMDLRQRMHDSEGQLVRAQKGMEVELRTANERISNAQSEIDVAKVVLQGKREELQKIRAEAFNCIARGEPLAMVEGGPPNYEAEPPAYSV